MAFRNVSVAVFLGLCVCLGVAGFGLAEVGGAEKGPVRNEKGERVWELNSYLKGTSDEIKQHLTAEVKRFKGLIAETTAAMEDDQRTIASHKAAVLAQYRARPDYAEAQVDAKLYEQKLAEARAAKDSRAAMDNSSRFNHAREAMAKIDRDAEQAAKSNTVVKSANKRLADQEAKLSGLKKGLADAIKWRDQVAGATRNTFRLSWPLVTGQAGTLGEVIPRTVDGDGNLVCSCLIAEDIDVKGQATEGISTIRVLLHPTMVTIKDAPLDVKRVKFDRPMRLDHSVSVVSVRRTVDGDIDAHLTVQVKQDDLGELLAAITDALAE